MFHGLTAWFSSSVSKYKKQLWLDNGGKEAKLDDAVYLFSQDENSTDTLGIFESDAYVNEQLSVFHVSYIQECVKLGNIRKGVLGKYFLPPKDIQEIGKKQKEYEWYKDGNLSDTGDPDLESDDEPPDHQQDNQSTKTNKHQSETTSGVPQSSTNNRLSSTPQPGPSGIQTAVRGSPAKHTPTDSSVHLPSDRGGKVSPKSPMKQLKAKNHSTDTVHRQASATKRKSSEGTTDKRGLKETKHSNKKRQSSDLCQNVSSDQVQDQEFWRIEDLAKITGELTDFVVGRNGCELIDFSDL